MWLLSTLLVLLGSLNGNVLINSSFYMALCLILNFSVARFLQNNPTNAFCNQQHYSDIAIEPSLAFSLLRKAFKILHHNQCTHIIVHLVGFLVFESIKAVL